MSKLFKVKRFMLRPNEIHYKVIAVAITILFCLNSYGQDLDTLIRKGGEVKRNTPRGNKITPDKKQEKNPPLIVIKVENKMGEFHYIVDKLESPWITPDMVSSITVLKKKEAINKYNQKAQNGVIIIVIKKKSFKKLPKAIKRSFTPIKN